MSEMLQFLTEYGAVVLVAIGFVEQIGLPLPAVPMLIAAGMLAGNGALNPWVAAGAAVAGAMAADWIWYEFGRRRGDRILDILGRSSLVPNFNVRQTENFFVKYGFWSLVLAKFVPGLSTMAPPLAGIMGLSLTLFFVYDGFGAIVWAGSSVGLGYVLSGEIDRASIYAEQVILVFLLALAVGLLSYVAYRMVRHGLPLRTGSNVSKPELTEQRGRKLRNRPERSWVRLSTGRAQDRKGSADVVTFGSSTRPQPLTSHPTGVCCLG